MQLDEYSQPIADRLFQEFPEFRSAVKPTDNVGCLCIEFPSPHADVTLFVSTEYDEITISMGGWHTHIGMFEQLSEEEELNQAVALIRKIMEDRLVVATLIKDGEWSGSWVVEPGEDHKPTQGETISVQRWSGVTNLK